MTLNKLQGLFSYSHLQIYIILLYSRNLMSNSGLRRFVTAKLSSVECERQHLLITFDGRTSFITLDCHNFRRVDALEVLRQCAIQIHIALHYNFTNCCVT